MPLNAGLQMMISMGESQLAPVENNFLGSEFNTLNTMLNLGATTEEINGAASFSTKLTIGLINYAIAHVAAGTPPAPAVKK